MKIKKILEKHAQDAPKHILRRAISKKLQAQGIEDDTLAEALTNHIASGNNGSFLWDTDDTTPNRNIDLKFTDEDFSEILVNIDKFLNKDIPTAISNILKDGSKNLVKSLDKSWPLVKIYDRNEIQRFRDNLDFRWSPALDPLRMLLISSREIGQNFANKLAKSRAKTSIHKRQAIAILHMRACQTAMEIIVLLENGLPDGAYSRWRTLYEISVVSFIIDKFGHDIAERYLAHDAVSIREYIVNEFKHGGKVYDPKTLLGEHKEIEDDFQQAISKFGNHFAGPYGWAADSLGQKSPRLQDLEKAVDWNSLPPEYKWASYKVHAGVSGTVRTLGTIGGRPIIHAGATNAGIETPAVNTAFSLLQITSLVFYKPTDIETQIQMHSLIALRDRVLNKCQKIARLLEEEDMEFQS